MNIGIDIDGVMTDIEGYELEHAGKFFKEKYGITYKGLTGYGVSGLFRVSGELSNEFWKDHFIDYCKNIEARDGVGVVTNKLHNEGYKIIIITARHYEDDYAQYMKPDEMPKIVESWLNKNSIYFDEIIYTKDDKINECKASNLLYMIEDKPKNIKDIAKINPVIVFDQLCNKDLTGKNIIHASSWNEIYSIIHSNKLHL